jgi:hypothetical protein
MEIKSPWMRAAAAMFCAAGVIYGIACLIEMYG